MSKRRRGKRRNKRGTPPQGLTSSQRSCKRKKRYKTHDEAKLDVARIEDSVVQIGGFGVNGRLEAYFCYRCSNWHVGHRRQDGIIRRM